MKQIISKEDNLKNGKIINMRDKRFKNIHNTEIMLKDARSFR